MNKNKNWTREETIIAFNVYCKIPFKDSSKSHPLIIEYANIIDRTPSALNMKIGNLGRLDPALKERGITGLMHGSKMEEEVWNEFYGNWDELAYESERLISLYKNDQIKIDDFDIIQQFPVGEDKDQIVKTRINQNFFRKTILSSYNSKCCITGIVMPQLLIASHIIPWSVDKSNRTNPHNGLCLNALHDKAFDKGLITITPDYQIILSDCLTSSLDEESVERFFSVYDKSQIILPDRFLPSKEFLEYHNKNIFLK